MYEYSKEELTQRRKRRRRRVIRKRLIKLFCILTVLSLGIGGIYVWRSAENSRKKSNIKAHSEIEMPSFVEVQLIPIGKARKGLRLKSVTDIVIHYVGNPGTTAQNNRDYFANRSTEVCSHFVVGLDGEIIECVPLDERSAASNNRNKDTVSIEVCHPDESGKFNEKTYASLLKLTAWLCDTYSLTEKNVIRHYDITGKLCPLYYVNNPEEWDNFRQAVKETVKEAN